MNHHVGNPKIWRILTAAVAAIGMLAACGTSDGDPGGPVPSVEDVTITTGGSLGLEVGDREQLGVEITAVGGASTDLTWSSSDDGVVTVDDDRWVEAIAPGTAVVTATSVADPSVSDSITIVVVSEPALFINDGEALALEVGETHVLSVQVIGADLSQEVAFESSAEGVATVAADGTVDAVSEGTATITATSVDDPSLSDAITVTVTPAGGGGGGGGDPVVDPSEVDLWVTSTEDTDPYDLDAWEPEAPVEGTLRWALANAVDGDVIGFEEGLTEVVLHGVDVFGNDEDVNNDYPGNVDSHLVFREDVTLVGVYGPVTIRGTSGWQAGDPGDEFTYRSRMMLVPPDVEVALQNLVITGGTFIFDGAGIRNDGTLTLRDVDVVDNRAWERGGGIFNTGDLTIVGGEIRDNRAATLDDEVDEELMIRGGPGSALLSDGGYGGGIFNGGGGTIVMTDVAVSGNDAKVSGAGIYDVGVNVTLTDSTIAGNAADEAVADTDGVPANTTSFSNYGGGVFTAADLTVDGTTFSDNVTNENGGGLYLDADGVATLLSASFTGNDAAFGGGIFHQYDGDPSNLDPVDPLDAPSVTFSGNTANSTADADYYAQDTGGLMALERADADQGPGRFTLSPERDVPSRHR